MGRSPHLVGPPFALVCTTAAALGVAALMWFCSEYSAHTFRPSVTEADDTPDRACSEQDDLRREEEEIKKKNQTHLNL